MGSPKRCRIAALFGRRISLQQDPKTQSAWGAAFLLAEIAHVFPDLADQIICTPDIELRLNLFLGTSTTADWNNNWYKRAHSTTQATDALISLLQENELQPIADLLNLICMLRY